MKIENIIDEAPFVKTFKLTFEDPEIAKKFNFKAGQFGEYSVFGEGESTFCIASSPTREGYIECTFREAGRVTQALAKKEIGDTIGFRGPYGNTFPIEKWFGKNIVFIAGGIGLAPIRCVIWNILDLRDKFKDVTIVYGAKNVNDIIYKHEFELWKNMSDVNLITTVDPGGETNDWNGKIGFVPTVLKDAKPNGNNSVALVCGPPIMIKLTLPVLNELGFTQDNIYTTLENRMKCGVGKCGHCTVGPYYVCKDGPVLTYEELIKLPNEY